MTTDTTPEPRCPMPPSEVLMSLTGYDEIAIAVHFGEKITAIRREDAITAGRALAFTHMRRSDKYAHDKDAYAAAMSLTMREVTDYFAPEPKTEGDADAEGNAPGA